MTLTNKLMRWATELAGDDEVSRGEMNLRQPLRIVPKDELKGSQPDLGIGLDLLAQASAAMAALHDRTQELERTVGDVTEHSKADLRVASQSLRDAELRAERCESELAVARNLIAQAFEKTELLLDCNGKLEELVASVTKKFECHLAESEPKMLKLEQKAAQSDAELSAARDQLKELEMRAEGASLRAERAERRAVVAEANAAEAHQWLERYYDKITRIFGAEQNPLRSAA